MCAKDGQVVALASSAAYKPALDLQLKASDSGFRSGTGAINKR